MADRYWVGGTGPWNLTNTANWSTSSNGSPGASVPTSAETVAFDSFSGTGTVTVDPNSNGIYCAGLDFTGYAGTFYIYNRLFVYGDLTLSPTMTYSSGGRLELGVTTTVISSVTSGNPSYIYTNGVVINSNIAIGNSTSTYPVVLMSDLYTSEYVVLTAGNNSNGYVSGPSYSIFTEKGITTIASCYLNITSISSLTIASSSPTVIEGNTNTNIIGGNILINCSNTVNISGFTQYSGLFKYIAGNAITSPVSQVRFYAISSGRPMYIETENSSGQYITFQGNLNIIGGNGGGPSTSSYYLNKDIVVSACTLTFHNGGTNTGGSIYSVSNSKIVIKAGSTVNSSSAPNSSLNGTAALSFEGTSTWSGNGSVFTYNVPITFNSAGGTITFGSDLYFRNVLTYTSGIINPGTTTFTTSYAATLNINSNCPFYNFTIGSASSSTTTTINGLLYINNTLTFVNTSTTNYLDGTGGFNTANIYCNAPGKTIVFNSGLTYTIRNSMINIGSSVGHIIYKSSHPTIQAIYTLDNLATQANLYTDGRLMNSALGQTVWVVNGALSGTTNWGVVPVPATTADIFY